ncbi:MAG: hypothetical protein A2043_03460 [Candidatus Schekmanbacteria bacterium GWA2_38_9]|uniref:Uncharacterized protein n=1 Tax=Candidatus Schekmanbacteria bacterium RIFCSPLOWO2_12_FULL_38_15 TaxID=1817883 RepID=A0A1F7SCE5_9BACT|nr:MAG: hypothetical protein A2043_03460 [Candidatus Schekmanbacteria bacterium GWA2_38_9]OGL51456.1 MAG: hypothetical protein A3G31_06290 [Candidatus Schekmanbacteria bacterium RIFCSPLOWO2_12_FULL_38_15]OGL51537.1 MAG: hypothetical protein A3H37_09275 [Candidatus Schekmanbacteria bacterium RIFCSPLOWO2_02_FULL_38_14]
MFEKVVEIIREHSKFLITTHINPDGDGLGSEVALAAMLKKIGKEAFIINESPIPENYLFLSKYGDIKVFSKEYINIIRKADVIFVVDISNWERVGEFGSLIMRESKALKICVDHHPSNSGFADLNIIDERASSTGELIYDLGESLEIPLNEDIATGIYVAIMTDTGSFRFPSTTSRVHMIVSRLLEKGIRPEKIYREIHERRSPSRMKVLGRALSNLNIECEGKVAWFYVTKEMLEEFNLNTEETDGFVNMLGDIREVIVSIFFLERNGKEVKVSLRSKDDYNVNKIANRLNGGGHVRAAGILMEASLKEAIEKVLGEVKKYLTKE